MELSRETARYIWHCIKNHDGFAEYRGDWCENLGIEKKTLDAFERLVERAINEMSGE